MPFRARSSPACLPPTRDKITKETSRSPACPSTVASSRLLVQHPPLPFVFVVLLRSSPDSPTTSACPNSTAPVPFVYWVPGQLLVRGAAGAPGVCAGDGDVGSSVSDPLSFPSSSPAFQRPAGRGRTILYSPSPRVPDSPLYILRLVPRPLPSTLLRHSYSSSSSLFVLSSPLLNRALDC